MPSRQWRGKNTEQDEAKLAIVSQPPPPKDVDKDTEHRHYPNEKHT